MLRSSRAFALLLCLILSGASVSCSNDQHPTEADQGFDVPASARFEPRAPQALRYGMAVGYVADEASLVSLGTNSVVAVYETPSVLANEARQSAFLRNFVTSAAKRSGARVLLDEGHLVKVIDSDIWCHAYLVSRIDEEGSTAGMLLLYPVEDDRGRRGYDGMVFWIADETVVLEAPARGKTMLLRRTDVGDPTALDLQSCLAACGGEREFCIGCCQECLQQAGFPIPQDVIDKCNDCIATQGKCLGCFWGLVSLVGSGAGVYGCLVGCGISISATHYEIVFDLVGNFFYR